MSRTSDNPRDRAVANEVHRDRALQCTATGCPNRWTVDAGSGRFCSAHAWVPTHLWPRVTQEQLDAETDRAMRAQRAPAAPHCGRPDIPRLRHELQRLADAMRIQRVDPKAWARRLQDRERRGERLTPAVREAWRAALGLPSAHAVDHGFAAVAAPAAETAWDDRDVPLEAYDEAAR
ncbi:hypothetical protein [Piscinibacter sakaiensis]|uniref:Uncharacterized protein n=1 Tax=Piscinibacter sakaiensis TaxID=1547922 RepID=A0A0K8P422_PISS1|nr:hypothetical protein [Piscinibacter sakaiensis]GAP37367.1 hypothetical protein ISF6_3222 [Piscinibacter sakaiensis]